MAPTILIAGATGNTGRGVVETLSELLNKINNNNNPLSGTRILALTRSLQNPVAQQFTHLPNVQVLKQNWTDITPSWLLSQGVTRAFIASHNQPDQFAAESGFHLALLQAGVQYVVRISTAAANVRPDCLAYYPRTHWAVEALLSAPEFAALQWTSLRPNLFGNFALGSAAGLIRGYRETGEQETLRLLMPERGAMAVVDPFEVGVVAAHLLAQVDPVVHDRAKYVVNGPEDVTGAQVVGLVEGYIGTRVESVSFRDESFVEAIAAAAPESRGIFLSGKHSLDSVEAGDERWSASATSREVLGLAAPTRTPAEVLKALLEE